MKGPAEDSQHIQYTGLIYKMFRDQQKTASIYSTLVLQDVKGPAEDSQRIKYIGFTGCDRTSKRHAANVYSTLA